MGRKKKKKKEVKRTRPGDNTIRRPASGFKARIKLEREGANPQGGMEGQSLKKDHPSVKKGGEAKKKKEKERDGVAKRNDSKTVPFPAISYCTRKEKKEHTTKKKRKPTSFKDGQMRGKTTRIGKGGGSKSLEGTEGEIFSGEHQQRGGGKTGGGGQKPPTGG